MGSYQMFFEILHGQHLNEPVGWLFIATTIAFCAAGWYCGDILFDYVKAKKENE